MHILMRRIAVSLTDDASRCGVGGDNETTTQETATSADDTTTQEPETTADNTTTQEPETTTATREYPASALKALFQWE